jgi:hypothetical protein
LALFRIGGNGLQLVLKLVSFAKTFKGRNVFINIPLDPRRLTLYPLQEEITNAA